MSLRSRNATTVFDENTANAKRSRYATRSKTGKLGSRSQTSRRALGDISNARNDWKAEKGLKKSTVGGDSRKAARPLASRGARITRAAKKISAHQATNAQKKQQPECSRLQDSIKGMTDLHLSSAMEIEEDEKTTLCSVDLRNLSNPQMCVEYIHEIMQYLKSIEMKFRATPRYMQKQRDINSRMREILIDWLNEVHLKFKLRIETLYLTINLIDRFLSKRAVSRQRLQLVGCTAMLIASKYEEIYAPEVRDFVYISDKAYTPEEILVMESAMLSALKFDLTVAYPLRFLERYIQLCDKDKIFGHLANFLTEMTLQKIDFLNFAPSMIAASAISFARLFRGMEDWNALLEKESGYSREQLNSCKAEMMKLLLDQRPKYIAVRKKYNTEKYGEVADFALKKAIECEDF
mmetsp:Transcript_22416/g.36025  ORF Transcript_22416/g.36025 Transcript_22416/m.36025 type:complete len:407 (+) Transcript_22416:54-1274(+)|eukprot:jgi/Bigna1/75910/fgenesh1_pg.38_\